MKDALQEIYLRLMSNSKIEQATLNANKHAIFYYKEPDGTLPPTLILIRPYSPPQYEISASDSGMQQSVTVQIDVQSTKRMTCKELQTEIEKELRHIGYRRLNGQDLDEYFEDSKRYVDARRYKLNTKIYEMGY